MRWLRLENRGQPAAHSWRLTTDAVSGLRCTAGWKVSPLPYDLWTWPAGAAAPSPEGRLLERLEQGDVTGRE